MNTLSTPEKKTEEQAQALSALTETSTMTKQENSSAQPQTEASQSDLSPDTVKLLLLQLVTKQRAIEAQREDLNQELIKMVPVEILQKQQALKDATEPLITQLQKEEADLAVKIKNMVVDYGMTIKSEEAGAQAIYVSPSPKWDNDKLEGFLTAFPRLELARTWGKPSVRILIDK